MAVNDEGVNAADLAESLDHFAITHFLRAYQAIEETPSAATTIVETEGPAPVPPPEVEAPYKAVAIKTPEPPDTDDATSTSMSTVSSLAAPVSDLFGETGGSTVKQALPVKQEASADDYFSRLSTLNPAHEAPQPQPAEAAPMGEIVEGDDALQNLTVIAEEPQEIQDVSDRETENVEAIIADEKSGGRVMTAFNPRAPRRKPAEDMLTEEPAIFSSVEGEQKPADPEPVTEIDVMLLAEVPTIPEPLETMQPVPSGEGGFFSKMREFDEMQSAEELTKPSVDDPDMQAPMMTARNAGLLSEYEQIRAAVIEKLRRESDERSRHLADVREEIQGEFEQEDMVREHESGSLNIQTELRAKQRATLTGTRLPPGYVPPPDGGTSGVRFLQRLGLYDAEDPHQVAETRDLAQASLPSGASSYTPPVLSNAGESILLPVLSPKNLASKSLAFVDSGYSAPPVGQTLNTSDDKAVAALGQIARLFQTPNIGYPSQINKLPAPGTLPSAISSQTGGVGITMPQSPTNAPLNAADLAAPPPISPTADELSGVFAGEIAVPPAMVQEFPVGPSALTGIDDPFQSNTPADPPAWDATATDNRGGVVAAAPSSVGNYADEANLTTRLARLLDQAGSSDDDPKPPVLEATGTWDVVSIQAAPTAARTLLGGPVVSKTSVAVSGGNRLSMGRSVVLGKAPPVGVDPVKRKKACIDKRRGVILFCIENIDWPVELENIMQVDTVMYQGLNAIVRYDNGVATRFHALFPSESFDAIVTYYIRRLGDPMNVWRRTISPLAAPDRENPTVSWQALNPLTQTTSILEIRRFDDTRGGFPDEKRGAVMLYSAQSGPIFPQVSAFELMRLHPGS